jgi:hypothetical protein
MTVQTAGREEIYKQQGRVVRRLNMMGADGRGVGNQGESPPVRFLPVGCRGHRM